MIDTNFNEENPLVSIVVVTYNSGKYILETLTSIYNQTYKKIELIISDDCSKDSTIQICQEWLLKNKERFIYAQVLTTNKNTGVAGNLNRGISKANGTWIKSIAGDDTLSPIAIEHYIKFATDQKCQICSAQLNCFGENITKVSQAQKLTDSMWNLLANLSHQQQYITSIKKHILPGPGIFYTKDLWMEIGGFDENYPFYEEFPFENKVLKLTKAYCIQEPLVNYRINSNSLSGSPFTISFISDREYFINIRQYLLLQKQLYLEWWDQSINYFIGYKTYKKSKLYPYIKLLYLLSPLYILRRILSYKIFTHHII